ncbi:MAG: acyl carrier protein [Patescibacteria group bacterium]|nr:acyl carrier protein [Patescibacteria group bacterium]
MENQEVFQKVAGALANQSDVKPEDVKPEHSLKDDLGFDSLDAVEAVMGLEEEFEITISDEEAEKIDTVAKAVELVAEKLAEKANKS